MNQPSSTGLLPTPPPSYAAKWKRGWSNSSRNRRPSSSSPPRHLNKKHKTTEERFSGPSFVTASPPSESLPFSTFLLTAEASSIVGSNKVGHRFSRDLLISLSNSAPTCLPPQLHRSQIRELDSRR
ncbi:hypothetical protein LINPERPRIM_LOCUS31815 [Linum perenne]